MVVLDRLLQLAYMGAGAATDETPRNLGEEAFHPVQPTGAGGGKVEVIAGVLSESDEQTRIFSCFHRRRNCWY